MSINARRLKRQRDRIAKSLARFSDGVFETVEYRSSIDSQPDGFPTNTRYGPRTGAGLRQDSDGEPEQATSTERAALRLVDGGGPRDTQQRACERIGQAFRTIWAEIDAAEKSWDVILHASDVIREREAQSTLGTCQACLADDIPNVGEDRIRSGYCPACYRAWLRTDTGQGRQDRLAFEARRRRLELVNDGVSFGYVVADIGALQTNGTLPSPRHARIDPDEAV